jgi:hypothetical protein
LIFLFQALSFSLGAPAHTFQPELVFVSIKTRAAKCVKFRASEGLTSISVVRHPMTAYPSKAPHFSHASSATQVSTRHLHFSDLPGFPTIHWVDLFVS